jgi:hypothetical protein
MVLGEIRLMTVIAGDHQFGVRRRSGDKANGKQGHCANFHGIPPCRRAKAAP